MSVSLSNEREIFEVETLRHQQSILPRNKGETHLRTTFLQKIVSNTTHLSRACMELKMFTTFGSLVVQIGFGGELGSFRRGKHSTSCVAQSTSRCENGSARRQL